MATALILGALALYLSPGLAAAEEDHTLEHLAIETADTPAEHTALAKHYHAKAADARSEARSHEQMAKVYGMGPVKLSQTAQMQNHCKKISQQFETVATGYEELAKLHEAAAKKAP
jgi:hypothetical protein